MTWQEWGSNPHAPYSKTNTQQFSQTGSSSKLIIQGTCFTDVSGCISKALS